MEDEATITFTAEQASLLMESLQWSLQATERSMRSNPTNRRLAERWECFDDILAQLQEVKRDRMYGKEAA